MTEPRNIAKKTTATRREFVLGAAATAFTIVPRHVLGGKTGPAPSEKLNLGSIGVGGMQGGNDVGSVSSENIYALCDVDQNHLNGTAARYPKAKLYRDFRKMLDKEHKHLDGVTVTIPDFMHATASLWAMERGIAVHCQKPLTATIWEARLLANAARKYQVATQMGNQGYSSVATRIACEYIWNDEIGDVREVHSWNGGGFSRGVVQWPVPEPVPATLDWNLWQGRSHEHSYSSKIHPVNWRGFLDYGTMMIGDWGIHQFGPANWALGLGETGPTSVECIAVAGANPVTYPSYACKIQFPQRRTSMPGPAKCLPWTFTGMKAAWPACSSRRGDSHKRTFAASTRYSWERRASSALAIEARAIPSFLVPGRPGTRGRRWCWSVRPATFRTGSAPARAANPRAPTSPLPARIPNGCFSAHKLAIPPRETDVGQQEPAIHQQREGQ